MICFYHSDNDGKCAGYWVDKCGLLDDYGKTFFKIDYGIDFPFDKIHENERVYIVDYSIPPEQMDKLLEITPNVVWIDHHVSAIEKYKDYDKDIPGLRYDGIAGCMLAYIYLQVMTRLDGTVDKEFSPDLAQSAPWFTKLIADYDVWTFEYGDDTRYFEKGFSLVPHEPQDEIWSTLLTEDSLNKSRFRGTSYENSYPDRIKLFIEDGKIITAYRHNLMKDYCEKKGFEANLNGHKCYAVNMALMGTDDFVIDNVDDYELLVSFSFDGEMWAYSLRSTTLDCAELAAKYGGGGHKGAAGFTSKSLVWEID